VIAVDKMGAVGPGDPVEKGGREFLNGRRKAPVGARKIFLIGLFVVKSGAFGGK
jgi:hypothetical protein